MIYDQPQKSHIIFIFQMVLRPKKYDKNSTMGAVIDSALFKNGKERKKEYFFFEPKFYSLYQWFSTGVPQWDQTENYVKSCRKGCFQ